jgi:hypothetical protein
LLGANLYRQPKKRVEKPWYFWTPKKRLSLWDSDTDVDAGYTAMVIDDDICRS